MVRLLIGNRRLPTLQVLPEAHRASVSLPTFLLFDAYAITRVVRRGGFIKLSD
jgi:hypothetical protein